MDKKILDRYLDKLQGTKLTNENKDEFLDFAIKVCNDYDMKFINKTDSVTIINEFAYIVLFFHKYCNKMYGINCLGKFDSNIKEAAFYDPNSDRIFYNADTYHMTQYDSLYQIFKIFHENRHAMQARFYKTEPSECYKVDPMSILILKEQLLINAQPEIYNNNHEKFIIENDANVYAKAMLKPIIENRLPRYREQLSSYYKDESNNFGVSLYKSPLDDSYTYNTGTREEKSIFFEIDKTFKKTVNSSYVKNYPLLKLICHENGDLKTYQEIIKDKEQLIKNNKDKTIDFILDSSTNYELYGVNSNKRRLEDQIDLTYKIVINSDPMLYLEDCLVNSRYRQAEDFFEQNPNLLDDYSQEIRFIFIRATTLDNYDAMLIFAKKINNKLVNIVQNRYRMLINLKLKQLLNIQLSQTINNSSGEFKTVSVLESEKINILKSLENVYNSKKITPKEYNELRKNVIIIYDKYKEDAAREAEDYLEFYKEKAGFDEMTEFEQDAFLQDYYNRYLNGNMSFDDDVVDFKEGDYSRRM